VISRVDAGGFIRVFDASPFCVAAWSSSWMNLKNLCPLGFGRSDQGRSPQQQFPNFVFQLRHAQLLLRHAQGTGAGPVFCFSASLFKAIPTIPKPA
ncbi:hypothetical protein L195_g032200, partial [Trifolium pratense]